MTQGFAGVPRSIREVSEAVLRGVAYASAVKEFAVYLTAIGGPAFPAFVWEEAPADLPDPVEMAHLGGLAEHLALASAQPAPSWCQRPEHFLAQPATSAGPRSRALAMVETPSAFRRRNLFCGRVLAWGPLAA